MNGRNAPLSPVGSLGGSEWSYPTGDKDAAFPNNRGQLITPPDSAGSTKAMNGGFPPGPRSVGAPSPPPSIGRSSNGTTLYARSESGRSPSQQVENQELVLSEHYVSLKRYLSATSRDGNPKPPPNKARDKLQRLTGVQFLELSTDVYDELKRRELAARQPPNAPPGSGPPDYLLPEENFHPKRNQARQKLSSLGSPRFRDLATDVFCELERRYPRFAVGDIPRVGSPLSIRRPPSRSQTPVNGMNGFPPRGQSRRRPSEASSIRSARGAPTPVSAGGYGVPPSPGLPNGDYGRPTQKQFQSNTIVPNKSTMVEEDDEPISPLSPNNGDPDGYGTMGRISAEEESKRNAEAEADKKLIYDYEQQIRELKDKMDRLEDDLKKKDDELNDVLDGERSRASAANMEKKEWEDRRVDLENRLADAQDLNDSLQRELERIKDDHASEMRDLREQLEDARQASVNMAPAGGANPELERENEELRISLREQQQVTEEVRREAQEFLREMRMLSQQSGATWERQAELEKTIESLETEVRDWRNRYARTKTQLRNMRASSLGLTIDQDAGKYVREKGFTQENGLVKDVNVTKFQIAIDELLQRARVDDPDRVIDAMKAVVVSVRRITKDIDDSPSNSEDVLQQQAKLKSRVSSTANNLITASKNFASSAGISPVSLLDAAASHLVAAVVELLRTVKIRSTPAGELEDDDDGTITPVDSTGFFSPRSNGQSQVSSATLVQDSLPPPPPFQGLGARGRASVDSSTYSPVSSPRESFTNNKRPTSRGAFGNGGPNGNGMAYMGLGKNLPPVPNSGYGGRQQDNRTEDLKIYLEDQTAVLVQTIQNLVQLIRNDADIDQVTEEINTIADVVGQVVSETEALGPSGVELVRRLSACRDRLMEAGKRGRDLAAEGKDTNSREWRMWTQTLPPIAFEIARETKELVQRVDQLVMNDGDDDFA
ncbi:protein SPA2 [Echria macrotheca]|uniref:Protein SPA2 n=1 Tax=Echria macrotheca TaxID=438768 RepID=A0AAJ0BHT9_9PEZI|nr:protein SPA2 [Echria macrotheca]